MNTRTIPKGSPRTKLTRAQIAEGLKSVPIATLMLGAGNAKFTKLTHKQTRFAQALALGESKAGAYRAAYDTQTNAHAQSIEGQRLAAHPSIAHQVQALKLALAAREYATPPALRALVIERLTAHAIDDDIAPAQRLRALELLGKVTEVAAFTERREIISVTDSATAKDRMMLSLRAVLQAQAIDVTPKHNTTDLLEPLTTTDDCIIDTEPALQTNETDDTSTPPTP